MRFSKLRIYAFAISGIFFLTTTFIACSQSTNSPEKSLPPNETTSDPGLQWIPANAKSVLWVGAHPDDEVYVAPLLDELCKNRKMVCNLLVMTDGGKGNCHLAGGCLPTVAAVRDLEMKNSANYFNAILEKPNFEDSPAGSPDGVLSAWNDSIGGGTKLLDSIASYISKTNPDIIFTFDPRHGSSCHLDHRAVGRLVMAAVLKVRGNLNAVFFPQAVWATGLYSPTQAWVGNEITIPKDTKVFSVESTANWHALIDILAIHKSQFPNVKNDYLDAFQYAPSSYKISPLLKAVDADMADPLYQNLCPYNDAHWPGR